jgi:hypothetical protein
LKPLQGITDISYPRLREIKESDIELPADHGGRLQQGAVARRQSIQPGGEQPEQAGRQSLFARGWIKQRLASFDPHCALLDKEAEDFLAEQWVATGPLDDLPHQGIGQAIHSKARLRYPQDLFSTEWGKGLRFDASSVLPGRDIFRPPGLYDQEVGKTFAGDDLGEDIFRSPIDPVNVLEQEDYRARQALSSQQFEEKVARA